MPRNVFRALLGVVTTCISQQYFRDETAGFSCYRRHSRLHTKLQSVPEMSLLLQGMVFALDNADAAGDVVDILQESLTLPETAPPTKLARLFLVSDILHNSTAPVRNASRYRSKLEAALPEVFESLQVSEQRCHSYCASLPICHLARTNKAKRGSLSLWVRQHVRRQHEA